LHQDIDNIIKYLSGKGAKPSIFTNLIPIQEDQYDLIRDHVQTIITTIDHVDEEGHDEQRGGHEEVIPTLQDLTEHGVPVWVNCVMTTNNYSDISRIYEWLDSLDIESIFFQPAYLPGEEEDLSINNLEREELESLFDDLRPWAEKYGFEYHLDVMSNLILEEEVPYKRCVMGRSNFVIYHDGRVQVCFHRQDLDAGNVLEDPAEDVLNTMRREAETVESQDCFGQGCIREIRH